MVAKTSEFHAREPGLRREMARLRKQAGEEEFPDPAVAWGKHTGDDIPLMGSMYTMTAAPPGAETYTAAHLGMGSTGG